MIQQHSFYPSNAPVLSKNNQTMSITEQGFVTLLHNNALMVVVIIQEIAIGDAVPGPAQ